MWLFQKIRHSLILKNALLLLLMLTFVLGTGFSILYLLGKKLLNKSVDQKASLICRENINKFDQLFFKCESIAGILTPVLAKYPPQEWPNILNFTFRSISQSGEMNILAIGAAPLPDNKGGKFTLILHPFDTNNAKQNAGSFQILTSNEYATEPWFADVVKNGVGKWNEPFQGKLVHELLATYSCPIARIAPDGSKKIIGVLCIDIGINWIDQQISALRLGYHGCAFLISDKMQLLSLKYKEEIGKKMDDLDPNRYVYIYEQVNDQFRGMVTSKHAGHFVLTHRFSGKKARFYLCPMRSTGWLFGIYFPEDAIARPLYFFRSCMYTMAAVVFILIACSVLWVTGQISHSLKKIIKFASEIGQGNFSVPVPQNDGKNEWAVVLSTIDKMRCSLTRYIENLKKVTEANERIKSELHVAQRIQSGLMPDMRPPFPDSEFFDASATLLSAKEIGGDLYDCAMIAPNEMCFIIGDVSGKGIPAALFMAQTQVMQRILRHNKALSPQMIVSLMNDILLHQNKERLFVTFLCGFINAKTGIVTYCNAGHNPFYILKRDGSLTEPCQRNGIPLGLKARISYTESTCKIAQGDTLVLYTDGVTEAEGINGQFYGTERFKKLLQQCTGKNLSANEVTSKIVKSVREFSLGCEQSDDITCLTIRYKMQAPQDF